MTLVRLFFTAPSTDGRVPAKGVLRWTPTRRHVIAGVTDEVVLPIGFDVHVSEFSQVPVDASGVDWVWRVDEKLGGRSITRYLVVPDVDTIDYSKLVEIDPSTLAPIEPPTEVWYAHVEALALTASSAKEAAEIAQAAAEQAAATIVPERTLAQTARTQAQTAATDAAESRTAAAGSATSAGNSAFASGQSAASALGAANAAGTSATAAQTARTGAETARTGAESAKSGAEAAQAGSEAAQTAAANLHSISVSSGSVNGAGDLILTLNNGSTVNAGKVILPTTLTVGTVNTLATGQPAVVTVTGTAPNQVINIDMPTGPQGAPGDMVNVSTSGVGGTITITEAMLPSTRLWTISSNVTSFTLPTPVNNKSGTITLIITQDATGGRTITWPASIKWPEGIAQQPASAANSVSMIHLLWTGQQWLGMIGGKSFA